MADRAYTSSNKPPPGTSIPDQSDSKTGVIGADPPPRWVGIASHAASAYVVLAVGILLSAAAAYWTADRVREEVRLKFDSAITDAQVAIESRVRAHTDVLLGVRGLFIASDFVSRADFRDYIYSLDLSHNYPGIEAISYAQRIGAAQKEAFEQAVRRDTSVDPRGYPEFSVRPPGERPEYLVVQYIEPYVGRERALGLDLGGDPVRLAALERARDSGLITATGIISLALDPNGRSGFVLRLPIYRKGMPLVNAAQRREAFSGMVATVVIASDLMRGVLSDAFLQTLQVRIHDAGFLSGPQRLNAPAASNLLFDSDSLLPADEQDESVAGASATAGLARMSSLDVGGRRWNLDFRARSEFLSFSDRWLPWAVMLGGAIVSLLLFGLIRSLASVGQRALTLAKRITGDLRRSEANLAEEQRRTRELIEALPTPVFFKGTDGRYLGVNKAWEHYFGVAREAFLGKTVHELYPNHQEVAQRLHAQDQLLWDHPGDQVYETAITTPDGKEHHAIFYKATLTQADGGVAGLVGTIVDITDRKAAEERVHHLAHYDELTGLPNRNMFNQRLGHALAQARRSGKPLAVLFIDLDRFKNINDTLGHEAGDGVLQEVGQRLQGCLRAGDTVARLGGDEFVVLIEELPEPMHVAAVAQKILAATVRPVIVAAQEYILSASIGISAFPDDGKELSDLMKNADIAMYRAKEQSGNNYQFYSAPMNVHTVERLALESALRRALERDEFLLHYQPKVDIASGRITGMEALVRWQRPGHGLIAPMEFIPLAEETGLIVPLGEWVLRTACARNKAWQDQGLPRLRIAVNLSARQFAHAMLLEDVQRVLRETGMDPGWLEFEITESMVMRDPEHAVRLLGSLKQMGIRLSIDDFGTGYSSLSYLKRFTIDSLKIDRSFIRDLPGDADDAAITQAIIAMARSLRLTVIAEGVEVERQLDFLRDNACDEMQGYHFSRPLPEDEFLLLLGNGALVAAPAA